MRSSRSSRRARPGVPWLRPARNARLRGVVAPWLERIRCGPSPPASRRLPIATRWRLRRLRLKGDVTRSVAPESRRRESPAQSRQSRRNRRYRPMGVSVGSTGNLARVRDHDPAGFGDILLADVASAFGSVACGSGCRPHRHWRHAPAQLRGGEIPEIGSSGRRGSGSSSGIRPGGDSRCFLAAGAGRFGGGSGAVAHWNQPASRAGSWAGGAGFFSRLRLRSQPAAAGIAGRRSFTSQAARASRRRVRLGILRF